MALFAKFRLMVWKRVEVLDRDRNLILKRTYRCHMERVYDLIWSLKIVDEDGHTIKQRVIEERCNITGVLRVIDRVESRKLPQLIQEILE